MPSYIYDMVDTWNAGVTTFTAIKMNVTDTASASGSLLMDLQVGGSSRFNVLKNGAAVFASAVSTGTGPDSVVVWSGGGFSFSSLNGLSANASLGDTILTRRAAASLRLGAADAATAVAQTLGVQSVTGVADTAGANFTIAGSQGTGTGAGGSIVFQVAPAGSSGTAQNALATALTITSAGKATFTPTVNSTSSFEVTNAAGSIVLAVDSTNRRFNAGGGSFSVSTTTGATTLYNAAYFGWQDGSTADTGTTDVRLYRDAANTLALRNGANAQTFRVYNTFTDASNYERGAVYWSSNAFWVSTENGGTGSLRSLNLNGLGLNLRTGGTLRWQIDTSGYLIAGADNTYDIGASGASRPRNIYAATSITGPHNMTGTAPASATATGAAGDVRYDADYIYVCTATNTWKRAAIATWP